MKNPLHGDFLFLFQGFYKTKPFVSEAASLRISTRSNSSSGISGNSSSRSATIMRMCGGLNIRTSNAASAVLNFSLNAAKRCLSIRLQEIDGSRNNCAYFIIEKGTKQLISVLDSM